MIHMDNDDDMDNANKKFIFIYRLTEQVTTFRINEGLENNHPSMWTKKQTFGLSSPKLFKQMKLLKYRTSYIINICWLTNWKSFHIKIQRHVMSMRSSTNESTKDNMLNKNGKNK